MDVGVSGQASGVAGVDNGMRREEGGNQRGHGRPGWAMPDGHCKNVARYSRHSGGLSFISPAKWCGRFGSKRAIEYYDVSCSVVFQSEEHKKTFQGGIVFHSGKQGMVWLKRE